VRPDCFHRRVAEGAEGRREDLYKEPLRLCGKSRALTVTKTALMPASSTYEPPESKASPSFPPRRRNHRIACADRTYCPQATLGLYSTYTWTCLSCLKPISPPPSRGRAREGVTVASNPTCALSV